MNGSGSGKLTLRFSIRAGSPVTVQLREPLDKHFNQAIEKWSAREGAEPSFRYRAGLRLGENRPARKAGSGVTSTLAGGRR